MNKKILLPVMALALTFASCDMDKEPYDQIPTDEYLTTPSDFESARNSLYYAMRISVGGTAFYNAPDIQGDEFNAVAGYLGTFNYMYTWSFASNMSEAGTVYANCQAIIAYSNFIIDGYNKCDMSNTVEFTPSAIATLQNIKGEAFFMRAYALYDLAQYFCADYEEENADEENSGVSFRTDFYPSSDVSTYPARKTLRETYKQITNDLDSAAKYITTPGARESYYVTKDAVTAMQARVALAMDDYPLAAQKAVDVINTYTYRFANSVSALSTMWENNTSSKSDPESIFKLAVKNQDERSGQTGSIFHPSRSGATPDYVPTQDVIDLYDAADYRLSVFFQKRQMQTNTGASGELYIFTKYPYEGYLYNQNAGDEYSRGMIEPKVLRISEMYLIAAEAYTMNDELQIGKNFLDEQLRQRGVTPAASYSGKSQQLEAIRKERQREFIGEGMRLFDLKRWHMGVTRGKPQIEDMCNLPGSTTTTNLTKSANDYQLVWPIPQEERDANPQVVQNPGY